MGGVGSGRTAGSGGGGVGKTPKHKVGSHSIGSSSHLASPAGQKIHQMKFTRSGYLKKPFKKI